MAIAATKLLQQFPFDQRGDPGEPNGLFHGSVFATGDGGGGNLVITLAADIGWAKGKIVLIKYLAFQGPDAGGSPDSYTLTWAAHYFNPGGTVVFKSAETSEGHASSADFLPNLNRLWIRPQDVDADPTPIVFLTTPNVNGESWTLEFQGQFWEQSTLRQLGRGPIIRY